MAEDIFAMMNRGAIGGMWGGGGGKAGGILGLFLPDAQGFQLVDLKQAGFGAFFEQNILKMPGKHGKSTLADGLAKALGQFDVKSTSVGELCQASIGDLTPSSASAIFGSAVTELA